MLLKKVMKIKKIKERKKLDMKAQEQKKIEDIILIIII